MGILLGLSQRLCYGRVRLEKGSSIIGGLDWFGNDAADTQAKAGVKQYQASSALYRKLVQAELSQLKTRSLLDSLYVHLALAAVGQENGEFREPCIPEGLCLVGPSWKAPDISPLCGFS